MRLMSRNGLFFAERGIDVTWRCLATLIQRRDLWEDMIYMNEKSQ